MGITAARYCTWIATMNINLIMFEYHVCKYLWINLLMSTKESCCIKPAHLHTHSVVGDRSQPGENEGLIFSGIVAQAHPHFERTLFGPMESLHQWEPYLQYLRPPSCLHGIAPSQPSLAKRSGCYHCSLVHICKIRFARVNIAQHTAAGIRADSNGLLANRVSFSLLFFYMFLSFVWLFTRVCKCIYGTVLGGPPTYGIFLLWCGLGGGGGSSSSNSNSSRSRSSI